MRFLMLNWRDPKNPLSGGAERVTLAYLKALVQRGHEVCWFANDFPGAAPEEMFEGIQIIRGGGKGSSIFAAGKWYRRQPKFDLVIDQQHGIAWFAPWWTKTNCVAYIHEVLGPIWNSFYSWPLNHLGRWQEAWTQWAYRRVPYWTPSESTRKILLAHGVHEVRVFPNGVDTRPLETLEPKTIASPLRLITVSRLAPNKRIDHAIRTIQILQQRNVPAHLTIVGGGDSEPDLKQLAAETGTASAIEFAGKLTETEKNRRLQQAHFLLHTSVREGWGLNVIEANAMGTPAIVYPVGGLVDSTVHGETGMVASHETPEAVADALAETLKSEGKYESLRTNAWHRSKTFAWDQVLPPVCDWLEQQAHKSRT